MLKTGKRKFLVAQIKKFLGIYICEAACSNYTNQWNPGAFNVISEGRV